MPLLKPSTDHPPWCEMERYSLHRLAIGETLELNRLAEKELLIVVAGRCELDAGDFRVPAKPVTTLALDGPAGSFRVSKAVTPTTLVRLAGRWGQEIGGAGLFRVGDNDGRADGGDPVDYPKTTRFDNHFHDYDEYWIIVSGRAVAWSEGRRFEVAPGDCVATAAGDHHDIAEVLEDPLLGVWFETTLGPHARRGHLWRHTHGPKRG